MDLKDKNLPGYVILGIGLVALPLVGLDDRVHDPNQLSSRIK